MSDDTDLVRIERALSRLRDIDRQVFLAHRLDGLSYETIADCTGLSVARVERSIVRTMIAIDREVSRPPRRWWFWPF